jgi:hypothetical protein
MKMSEMLSKFDAAANLWKLVFKLNYVITGNIHADKTSARETQHWFSKHDYQL